MGNRYLLLGLAGLLAVAVILTWGYSERRERLAMKRLLDAQYQKAFTEMMDSVENVEVNLGKTIVSGSIANNALIMGDIWRQANEAQTRLSELPVSHPVLERTSVFLAQTGDYAYSLVRAMSGGKQLSPEDVDRLEILHKQAGDLSQELHRIFASAEDGRFTWGELGSGIRQRLPRVAKQDLSASMESIDKKMQEYPTLIYDGPFSDHVNKVNPRGITDRKINREEAREIARQFIDLPPDQISKVDFQTPVNGEIPVYRVKVVPEDRKVYGTMEVDVSISGGHVVMAANPRIVENRKISEQEALEKAREFIQEKGLGTMENTFYSIQDNILLAAFAFVQDGVMVYPDQAKVQIAMDNGQVLGFEALAYYMNHHKRDIPPPKISAEEARERVNKRLSVGSPRLAIIPRTVRGEVLTYEFKGEIEGDVYYVYINALTGAEENILKLIKAGEGSLAM